MPLSKRTILAGGDGIYPLPFVGPIDYTHAISVDVTALSNKEVDEAGYLKPGVPLTEDGELVGDGDDLFGVTIEPLKVAEGNEAAHLAAAPEAIDVAVATFGQVNRKVVEDILDRVLTAHEIGAFGGTLKLLS